MFFGKFATALNVFRARAASAVSLLMAVFMMTGAAPTFGDSEDDLAKLKLGGATGGILRFPNTNQEVDDDNTAAEAWVKADIEMFSRGDTTLKAFVLSNYEPRRVCRRLISIGCAAMASVSRAA